MLGLLRYPDDFSKSRGLLLYWYKDDGDGGAAVANTGFTTRKKLLIDSIEKAEQKGDFSFCIPLSHIFGFCEDYDKVIYGVTHTLELYRKNDNAAIFKGTKQTQFCRWCRFKRCSR